MFGRIRRKVGATEINFLLAKGTFSVRTNDKLLIFTKDFCVRIFRFFECVFINDTLMVIVLAVQVLIFS